MSRYLYWCPGSAAGTECPHQEYHHAMSDGSGCYFLSLQTVFNAGVAADGMMTFSTSQKSALAVFNTIESSGRGIAVTLAIIEDALERWETWEKPGELGKWRGNSV